MFLEGLCGDFFQLVGVLAGGVQLSEQSRCLPAQCGLDLGQLVEVVALEDFLDPVRFGLDAADSSCLLEQCLKASVGQPGGLGRRRCGGQDGAGLP